MNVPTGNTARLRLEWWPPSNWNPWPGSSESASSERVLPLRADAPFLAQPGRNLVLDPRSQVVAWRLLHIDSGRTSKPSSGPTTKPPSRSSGPKPRSIKNASNSEYQRGPPPSGLVRPQSMPFPTVLTVLTVLTVAQMGFARDALSLMMRVPARPSRPKVISIPSARRGVCTRRSRPARARGDFGHPTPVRDASSFEG
jgi:hypothetical protein